MEINLYHLDRVCMYACIYIYTYMHAHTCIHMYIYIYIYIYIQNPNTHIHTYTHTHIYIYIYTIVLCTYFPDILKLIYIFFLASHSYIYYIERESEKESTRQRVWERKRDVYVSMFNVCQVPLIKLLVPCN